MKVSDINGLILAGGNSQRMGEDKAAISYHGKPQVDHLWELMHSFLKDVFVSVRHGQSSKHATIEDAFDVEGPLNGLLSAYSFDPTKAWLVVAVDMPMVNRDTIKRLINRRSPKFLATAYISGRDRLPEPLAAIWEPTGLTKLKKYMDLGEVMYPRRFLVENEVRLVEPQTENELLNVNEPTDLARLRQLIKSDSKA